MNPNLVFLLNLLATWYMVGLIWMVQIVHYNMFDRVGLERFSSYERDHNRLITPIVGPPMLLEITTACLLLIAAPAGLPKWVAWVGVMMVAGIWLSTIVVQVPCHNKLLNGFDIDAYRTLVNTNWIRTFLWSARGCLMGYFAWRLVEQGPR